MKRIAFVVLLLSAFVATSVSADSETYFRFKAPPAADFKLLTRIISIDRVQDGEVRAYANEKQMAAFERLGYDYTILPSPGSLIQPKMANNKSGIAAWDAYPTYDAYVTMMNQFALDYPTLCQVQSVGTSIQGRQILFAKISDNVTTAENEPEVMYTSSMHGDEITGYVLMLRLIDSLLTGYTAGDTTIVRLVDNLEIWINPLANPDGAYITGNASVAGAQRYNANFIDLNRNYPDPQDGPNPDGNATQQETQVMIDFAAAHHIVLSANFHGGIELINYPWDTWSQRHADDTWFQVISHLYADSARYYSPSWYMDPTGPSMDNGITNGYDWYEVNGGRQDFMIYWHGGRETTIELSNVKLIPAVLLPVHWLYNKTSLLQYLAQALYGIRGIVTDASSTLPIATTIRTLNHDVDNTHVFTDPAVGDYHRMLSPGTYDLEFSALGYFSDTVSAVPVLDGQVTIVNVALTPMPIEPVIEFAEHDAVPVIPGDTVSMLLSLTNVGAGVANSVGTTLMTDDTLVTITQAGSGFPPLAVFGDTQISNTAFEFIVAASCPIYHEVTFDLEVTADGGYLDTIVFSLAVGQPIEDFETVAFDKFPWLHSGHSHWQIVSDGKSEGSYSAASGLVGDNEYSRLSLSAEVLSDGQISFAYQVTSELGYDFLKFLIDNNEKGAWSGESGWVEVTFPVMAGEHTFSWEYRKDCSVAGGRDRAGIDNIIFPLIAIDPQITTLSIPEWTQGQPYTSQLDANPGIGTLSWSDKNADLATIAMGLSPSGLINGIPNAAGEIQFVALVTDQIGRTDEQQLSLNINPIPVVTTETVPDADRNEAYSFSLAATGGTPPVVFADRDNDLTALGLNISTTGVISGVPTSGGLFTFTVQLEDAAGAISDKPFSLIVNNGCCTGLTMGNVDCAGIIDIGDITKMIQSLFITLETLCCTDEGDLDRSGNIDIGDLTMLIASLFINLHPLPACP